MTRKQTIQLLTGVLIAAVALYLVFKDVTFDELVGSFKEFRWVFLLPSMAVFYLSVWLRGVRWRWLFKPHYDVSTLRATGGIFICFAFNSVLPARAGEFARAYLIGEKEKTGFSTAFATVVAERLLDMLTLLASLVVVLNFVPISESSEFSGNFIGIDVGIKAEDFDRFRTGLVLAACALGAGILFIGIPKTRSWFLAVLHKITLIPQTVRDKMEGVVHNFASGLSSFRSVPRVAVLLAFSLAIWLLGAWAALILSYGSPFPADLTFMQAYAIIIITCIFIALSPVPGYWGFFEAGIVFALVMMLGLDSSDSDARAYAVILHLSQYIPIVAIGLPWAWFTHVSVDEIRKAEQRIAEETHEAEEA